MKYVFDKHNNFITPIWRKEFPEFVKNTNKICDEFINNEKNKQKEKLKEREKQFKKKLGDFGHVFHTPNIHYEPGLQKLVKIIGEASLSYLNDSGVDTNKINLYFTEFWVQEFGKKGGAQHDPHLHWNNHVSGFYFLKANELSSYPVFHEPRQAAWMSKLPERDAKQNTPTSSLIHYTVKPGTMLIFPSYLVHQFAMDIASQPFRFIHWNMQGLLKEIRYG